MAIHLGLVGKPRFVLFQSLTLSNSHSDDVWKLMLYLGMFLDVHADSYKPIFNCNSCTNPPKTHQGALTLLQHRRKTRCGLWGDISGWEDVCCNNPFRSLRFHLQLLCPSCQHPAASFGWRYPQPCLSESQHLASASSCSWCWQAPADVLQIGSSAHLCGAVPVTTCPMSKAGLLLLVHALHDVPGVCFQFLGCTRPPAPRGSPEPRSYPAAPPLCFLQARRSCKDGADVDRASRLPVEMQKRR